MSMNSSMASSPVEPAAHQDFEQDLDDPLCITESDRKNFNESDSLDATALKRKLVQLDEDDTPEDGSIKKSKTEENGSIEEELGDAKNDTIEGSEPIINDSSNGSAKQPKDKPKTPTIINAKDFDVTEKLKEMGDEISIKSISRSEKEQMEKHNEEAGDKVSVEISKKDKSKELQERKIQNLRKNIKDVIDESQLDATTLAAQRQEHERLVRVQEQQRLIRDAQRQIAAEKMANKTQQKVLSLLQGESSDEQQPLTNNSTIDLDDPLLEKLAFNSSVSISPAAKAAMQSISSLISTDDQIPDSEEEEDDDDDDDDDDVIITKDETHDKSKAVVVDSSSDSDDCIILSDEEEEEEEVEDDENNSGEHTNDLYNTKDPEGRVSVNVGHGEKEQHIYVAPQISRIIKPHQIGGVRFLFDNIIESIELFDKSTGFGCILAHSMGLGKTLQLVTFCDIFLRHTSSKTVLIIMPINTLQNWLHEFNMWLPLPEDVEKSPLLVDGEVRPRNFNIYLLNDSQKTLTARARAVLEWKDKGGVLMMGYEMYRLLSLKKLSAKKPRKGITVNQEGDFVNASELFDKIYEALVKPGPDLVVCDEGHRIKNAHASTSLALKQIKSKRRIVLTGYPLQNNLLEYWCMVDFVRPSYLGTKTEFSNMFERPIQNGQCIDSTPQDCKLMRYRAHVLHSLLKGFVQRRSHTVLQKCLPEKTEFVLLIRMTPFQRKLYTVFMDEVVRSKKVPNPLKAFSVCCKIWNHPDVLQNFLKKRELDLELELEESEAIAKAEAAASVAKAKRGPKPKENKAESSIEPAKADAKQHDNLILNRMSAMSAEPFKPPMTPSSNDSAYSSTPSINSTSFDSTQGTSGFVGNSYTSYQNYDGASNYQNYNYNNTTAAAAAANGTPYQNYYNNGNNYWPNTNYYPPQADYPQNYYGQTPNTYPNYYGGNQGAYQATQPPQIARGPVKPNEGKPEGHKDGGLLADVIKEETKEQRDKDPLEKSEPDVKDMIVAKSSRDDGIPYDWAVELMKDYVSDLLENSPKMEIFFCILNESIKLGDRLLVFSQSLLTLNLLERFLQSSKMPNTDTFWAKNQNYFRLDGSTAALEREKLINEFNSNDKVKMFLVSTRAGSLGINLVGANRVIVFDASWNPCHDTQAVCRVYRYGQAKSCFVYRFVMDNCLEKKIYDRQINKQGMADRVVDECNPDAHLSMREVTSLCYDDGDDPEVKDFKDQIESFKDLVAKKILECHSTCLTKEPFQHESLLVDRKEKKLSQAEKRLAQRGYEMEKQAATKPNFNYNSNYRAYRTPDGSIVHRPVASVRPMQSDGLENNNSRPNRWVPVEVWQSKGLTAQEMTLPQDVSIQTNSADKSKIFLKAGQKVIVLKSPKGICLQLESGKVIAIRASMKGNQPGGSTSGTDLKAMTYASLQESAQKSNMKVNGSPASDGDVINLDDDDEDGLPAALNKPADVSSSMNHSSHEKQSPLQSLVAATDPLFKEKTVYKPNLVPRTKPKMPPPAMPTQNPANSIAPTAASGAASSSSYQSQQQQPPQSQSQQLKPTSRWDSKWGNGRSSASQAPFNARNPTVDASRKPPDALSNHPRSDTSAFHSPAGTPAYPAANPSVPLTPYNAFPSQGMYGSGSYHGHSVTGYSSTAAPNYNYYSTYPGNTPYASGQHGSFTYPPPPGHTYDAQFPATFGYNPSTYNQPPPAVHSFPAGAAAPPATASATATAADTTAPVPPTPQAPYASTPTNYGQWPNFNN